MKTFAEKILQARVDKHMIQSDFANMLGLTTRTIQHYESGFRTPRLPIMMKIAKTLGVSVRYLNDDTCENPLQDIEKDIFISEAHAQYGSKGVRDVNELLSENQALFAGGELSQEQKDEFFQAIMHAYETCKAESKKKFGKKPKVSEK